MTVITRFAPSPTGFLHIGGARTALFNYLYAKNQGGKFYLRIEDTDQKRSTNEAIDAILYGLKWLGLDWDGEEIYQSKREQEHKEVVAKLLETGKAYRCFSTQEELAQKREEAQKNKQVYKYDRKWRDFDSSDESKWPHNEPVIRFRAPIEGETIIEDVVQGRVVTQNQELDDFVIARKDGTPTYMLACVVDDHDMGITHIIRGDDHLNNTFKQKQIYDALNWDVPVFTHIPLIHGSDGAKLSKRHGALGVGEYEKMGFLADAMCNYLLRLGWSHGNDEIINRKQAIEWFNLESIGKGAAKFDIDKLEFLNAHYIKAAPNQELIDIIMQANMLEDDAGIIAKRLEQGLDGLKQRAKRITELCDAARIYMHAPIEFTDKAQKALNDEAKQVLAKVVEIFENIDDADFISDNIELNMRNLSETESIGLGKIMMPIRAAITGSHVSPSMFEVIEILGKEETIARIKAI